jgi:hypothetical protein
MKLIMLQKFFKSMAKKKSFNTDGSGLRIQPGTISLHGAKSVKLFRFRIELWHSNHEHIELVEWHTHLVRRKSFRIVWTYFSDSCRFKEVINYLVNNNKNKVIFDSYQSDIVLYF